MGLKTHTKNATMPGPTWCQVTEQKFATITYFRWLTNWKKEKRQKTVFCDLTCEQAPFPQPPSLFDSLATGYQ